MDLLYLDLCCYKRPFDDQRDERVRREAAAVAEILTEAEAGRLHLVCSPALRLENGRNPREDRRVAADLWLDGAAIVVELTPEVAARARTLEGLGFRPLDALHTAFAERAGARCLVTCDDALLSSAARHRESLRLTVVRPEAARPVEPA